ncbi:calcium-binding protein [Humisphaera borealis]|uniref:Calcium-binding protein n=1 Tax=Humisphaera borealis TaxID=2807512 RepID=A0A7M2WTT8_9BACT|nr:calcium-binding protein [Humisphaera borealis]QOV88896.1 hypothetical protein IPV69_22125 [Humisphaera borealis]
MLLESLESRRLMSVSLSAAGVLTVTGKNDPNPANGDHINIYVSGSNLKVNDNSAVSTFQLTKVKSLVVNLRAGDDNLTIDPNVTLPSTIDSGTATSFAGDVIQGGSGPDLIYLRSYYGLAKGGAGNDTLQNLGGINILSGDGGDDVLINKAVGTTESKFAGGSGTDTIDYSTATYNMILRNGQVGEYFLSNGAPVINGPGLPDAVETMENFYSGSGNDYIYGTSGNNIIRAGAGKDQVRAGAGNDTINGGTGEDALFGEDGNDTFYSKDSTKDFLSGGIGTDKANKDAIDVINSVEASF